MDAGDRTANQKHERMKSMTYLQAGALATALMLTAQSLTAQHLEAGAVGQNQNDALVWENAAELASSSGYVKELTLATTGRYTGLYNGNITLVAMSSAVAGGPARKRTPGEASGRQHRSPL